MDTQSGRIYSPEEYAERLSAREARRRYDDHQAEFEKRLAECGIVEVSERVAQQQIAGQIAIEKRLARRKASKAARKKNR